MPIEIEKVLNFNVDRELVKAYEKCVNDQIFSLFCALVLSVILKVMQQVTLLKKNSKAGRTVFQTTVV